ncbi:hypothetical protein [Actinomadura rayongensis]|uniref:Uncharacterized protein n=1 Tax=Actinomadura rayongensis TaxID=1429076 RepID=A0A6I4WMR3_9ACTN|nr:hypothetical protein [Actinomadura rayongensis]MXQ67972.1 hypothetical protein [Actinomadura rayongensis]
MADLYELVVDADLPGDLTAAERAELRWHLGLGPRPLTLAIVTDFTEVVFTDDGEPAIVELPEPLLAERGAALRVGGPLTGAFTVRDDGASTLLARQEVHPDSFLRVGELLRWLERRATRCSARVRFHEDEAYTDVANGDLPG